MIGVLGSAASGAFPGAEAAFIQGLKDTGFIEGKNISIEWRWAEGQYNRLSSLAGELVARNVSVISAFDVPSAFAAKAATKTIPIVFVTGADPVKLGLVDSLNQPRGNLTGVSTLVSALGPKQLELLHEMLPSAGKIVLLVNADNPNAQADAPEIQAAADALGQRLEVLTASTDGDLEAAFTTMVERRAGALVVKPDPFFIDRCERLVALAARHSMPAISPTSTATAPAERVSKPVAEAAGERRHVTVMFCDLVGSTGIAARLDAEEWRDLVGGYLDAASAAVTEMGGKIAKKLGDGLMALFGYPVAQENDAERAVRAALLIQRALPELNRKNEGSGRPALAARIAIDCGPVVVDATGEIFGDVPNVAARAQARAEPGSVMVTARVLRQVAGLFVAEERGSHDLKGVPEPVALYRIVRASGGGRRAGQRHLTPLVGRDEEISMLMRRWERACQGDGQLVLIVGEPGLGKSRLIEEFHARLREVPHTWVEWSCSQLLQNTPLHPVTEWGRQRFGGTDVPAERRLADLENTLTLIKFDPAENDCSRRFSTCRCQRNACCL